MSSKECYLVVFLILITISGFYLKSSITMWRNLGTKESLLEKLVHAPGIVVGLVGGVLMLIFSLILTGLIIWEILGDYFKLGLSS